MHHAGKMRPRRPATLWGMTLPQGSVKSPALFIFFISNQPQNKRLLTSYTEDMHTAHLFTNPQNAAEALTVHKKTVKKLGRGRKTTIISSIVTRDSFQV